MQPTASSGRKQSTLEDRVGPANFCKLTRVELWFSILRSCVHRRTLSEDENLFSWAPSTKATVYPV